MFVFMLTWIFSPRNFSLSEFRVRNVGYYSFNVTTPSNVSLNLTGLIANANVELLNSSGGVISSSTAGGTTFHNY